MPDVTIQFPKADQRALFRQIDRAQRELGKSLGQSVRFAAHSVATSIASHTVVAPKYREYVVVKEPASVVKAKGGKKYEITSYRKGGKNTFMRRAASVAALKKTPQVIIGKAGLAKASWMWGISKLGPRTGVSAKGITRTARARAGSPVTVRQTLKTANPTIRITNALPYAMAALEGGQSTLNSAMGKGSRIMAHRIDGNLKKMGAK